MKKIVSTNPGQNYEVVGEVPVTSKIEIKEKVYLANQAKEEWKKVGLNNRIELIKTFYQALKAREDEIASLITREVGTPITECKDEVDWDWGYLEWFIDNVDKAVNPEITFEDESSVHQIWYEPIGSVAVITPWNLPFDLFIWGVIPNLLVGNTVIYKAAEECVLTGKLFEEIAAKIGFPKGVLSFIHGDANQGRYLTQQEVDMIWFTGSSAVGTEIFKLAGKKFIKSVLEMGGSNPAIIFDDVDVNSLLDSVTFKRFSFCGQTCDADKRLIVHKRVYDEFISKFKDKIETIKVGNPQDSQTQLGSLVSKRQLNLLISQVKDAIKNGAKVISGGKQPDNLKGAYYLPTILGNIKKNMRVWQEEVFGPVIPVVTFSTEEEATTLANDTKYGLGSQIFSHDLDKVKRVAKELKAGNVDVNGCGHFKPYNPFGGYKNSGMGREHGILGFRELCQIKTVSMKK